MADIPLSELEPSFRVILEPGRSHGEVDKLADAQGVMFLCPKCFKANGGRVGTHMVICWFRDKGVSDDERPGPGRWWGEGTGLKDLTLRAGSSSILLKGGCNWHGWVRNGRATI